ncbi:uncharacterized protein LOC115891216 [Sitophilus oryzae]|uniref:Uncharacterized protein LOC115891216 n=1 Tax=Sitophilus oryzae TaxID=7048 RepID=A0A6J2YXB8_SITOR|nr:uncharacterized protein LOC115891216 [Sitophilus oryzae]
MGDLPEVRVNTFGVFENVGTDYGGPFYIKNKKGRGATTSKAYLCLFICMSTKAVHLELVSDLTSECFIAALNRFTSRRGKPKNIYSDNGLNYVGANRELSQVYNFLNENAAYLGNKLADENIFWHFIPANSPTFGGLWEAGIKSAKHHIKRVIGNTPLTFEEFGTFLVQIEGILNSRPLCPLTEDPEDCASLTPAHFLNGRTITSTPQHNLTDVAENRLSRWQHIQAMVQHYWQRWQKEYLGELQTRTKWRRRFDEIIKVGSMVLIKDDNVPVLEWRLGRVTELHSGADGVVRVVTVKGQFGSLKRAINRICVLPVETEI